MQQNAAERTRELTFASRSCSSSTLRRFKEASCNSTRVNCFLSPMACCFSSCFFATKAFKANISLVLGRRPPGCSCYITANYVLIHEQECSMRILWTSPMRLSFKPSKLQLLTYRGRSSASIAASSISATATPPHTPVMLQEVLDVFKNMNLKVWLTLLFTTASRLGSSPFCAVYEPVLLHKRCAKY
jgi:hypothetical protein